MKKSLIMLAALAAMGESAAAGWSRRGVDKEAFGHERRARSDMGNFMFLDAQCQFSDSQALTATALATNVIDLGVARPLGNGEPMAVVFNVEVAADQTTGDEDYTFVVEVASDAGITTARKELGRVAFESGTPTAPARDADLLVAGYKFAIVLPPITTSEDERYLAVRYTLAGTTPTITVSAHLMPLSMVEVGPVHMADGITIS